jgi:peptide/nickel transport system substrate-binding protein
MFRTRLIFAFLAVIQFTILMVESQVSLAREWTFRVKPKGTLKVVDLYFPSTSIIFNYAEALAMFDKNNDLTPGLAQDWRWINDRTLEFELRQGVYFHNGEKFNADAVRVNWNAYKEMPNPMFSGQLLGISKQSALDVVDEHTIRFHFIEPDGLALFKIARFFLFAPAYFQANRFEEYNWGYLKEAGPWGTGPFELVEGGVLYAKPGRRIVLRAFNRYWDRQYPKLKEVIFDNDRIGDRDEAVRLCREEEGYVDIVSYIRPLDTLKVAESFFAKVVKSHDDGLLWGVFNQRKRGSKWRDIRLRKAVNYAINREELRKYAAKGSAYNLQGYIPQKDRDGALGIEPYSYDTERARSLIAEAGYPKGFELEMISYEALKLESQIISRMLERIGLKVQLEIHTLPAMMRKFYSPLLDKPPKEQSWDIMIGFSANTYGHIGMSFLHFFIEGDPYRWAVVDPRCEAMWDGMIDTVDLEAQKEKARQMARYVYERAYSPFIYSPMTLYAVNKEVNFIPQKSLFLRLKETSVTENHWSIRGKNN